MKLIFPQASTVDIDLLEVPIGAIYKKIYRNLQHVSIPFSKWDNPFWKTNPVAGLQHYAEPLGIEIDTAKCQQQEYFNQLHKIFEKNYNGDPRWLPYHEHIHLCEIADARPSTLVIDYREQSGMLHRPFDRTWLEHSQTQVKAGDVYVEWAELGKIPYEYWHDNEPNDIGRMCELAKPWLILRPKIHVAFKDIDFLENKQTQEFQQWWQQYHDSWCHHWNIPSWSIHNMYSVLVFGRVQPSALQQLKKLLESGVEPQGVSL